MNNIASLPKGFVLYSERYQYTIAKVIGRGTNGYVYLASLFSPKHNASCQVALKEWASADCCQRLGDMSIQYPKDLKSEILYRNFMDEYTVLSKINHPNVVRVYDCMCTNGTYYYSMEYLSGGTLADCIIPTVKINEAQGKYIVKQIALGLEAFHKCGYVHSDLKLNNIVIRSKNDFVLIDGGANNMDFWVGGGEQNMFLTDICALANILLCLLSGLPDMRPEYEKAERMFSIAKNKGNLSVITEKAIKCAFSAKFRCIHDFISALEGNIESCLMENEIPPSKEGNQVAVDNDPQKAKDFLEKMRRTSDFYISKAPVELKEVESLYKGKSGMYGLQKVDGCLQKMQEGFVLGLRLLSPQELSQYALHFSIKSGSYLTYDSQQVKFYMAEITKKVFPWQKVEIKLDESDGYILPDKCKFYFASNLDPLIADSHRIHPFAKETQLFYEVILPASIFGFCKVSNRNKWGMVSNIDWVSMAIDCRYDRLLDIAYIAIPGPGIPPMFIGTIGYVGEQIDVYELVEGGHLRLKVSMTQADWNRRSRYS